MPSKIKGQSDLCRFAYNRNNLGGFSGTDDAVQLAFPGFKGFLLFCNLLIKVIRPDDTLLDMIQNGINNFIHEPQA